MVRKQQRRSKSAVSTKPAKSFAQYDNRKFAVLLRGPGSRPVYGTARFQNDDQLGNILRIAIDDNCPGNPEIIVSEDHFNGLITQDIRHGCDYCLFLTPRN